MKEAETRTFSHPAPAQPVGLIPKSKAPKQTHKWSQEPFICLWFPLTEVPFCPTSFPEHRIPHFYIQLHNLCQCMPVMALGYGW